MMKLHEKIRKIREEKDISREELYERLKDIFGDNAITPNSIWRIEAGIHAARASSLHQICVGLGISLKDILEETAPESKLVDIVKKNKRIDSYVYNQKAQSEILTSSQRGFLVQELALQPAGATRTEEDPVEVGKFEKFIYCLSGKITCIIGTERHILNKGDCLSFQSTIPHYFENNSSRKASCLIIQNPRYI